MSIISHIKNLDKKTGKYFPIFSILIYGLICGFNWSGNEFIWDTIGQDIVIGLILLNQASIISYLTFYKD